MTTLDMQTLRYINVLGKVSRVYTTNCFTYNNMIVYIVPKSNVRQAIGQDGKNVRIIRDQLGKRIKIVVQPDTEQQIGQLIQNIVEPVTFKSVEVTSGEVILSAGMMDKAALIGRNKRRLLELAKIVESLFGKQLKIV